MEKDEQVQRSIIWFLWKKGKNGADIHRELVSVCAEYALSERTVRRWLEHYQAGKSTVEDSARSGRPATSISTENIECIENAIAGDPHITIRELSDQMAISMGSIQDILRNQLGLSKRTAKWVPKCLTPQMKHQRVTVCRELLQRYQEEGENFLKRIITTDEKWFSLTEPATKQESRTWIKVGTCPPVKPRPGLHDKKRMALVFWDMEGVLMTKWVQEGATVTAAYYCQALTELKETVKRERRGKWTRGVLLQHDNARPHTAVQTSATIRQLGFELIPHPPYSPDLAPSDYWLFSEMVKQVRGKRYEELCGMAGVLARWSLEVDQEWFAKGIRILPERWERCIRMRGDYVEAESEYE